MHNQQTIRVDNLAVRKNVPAKNLCCGIQIGRDGCGEASGGGFIVPRGGMRIGCFRVIILYRLDSSDIPRINRGCVVVGLCRMQVQRTLVPPSSFFISFHSSPMRHQKNIFYPFVDTSKQTYQSLTNKSILEENKKHPLKAKCRFKFCKRIEN